LANRGPSLGVAVLLAVLAAGSLVGAVAGVGPLATAQPPDKVTDPAEMLARSLQSIIDAESVHLDASVSGSLPGSLLDRPDATVVLDGTTAEGDIRPKDAKTRAHVQSVALGVDLEAVSDWDAIWYRTGDNGAWTKASIGALSANAGVDINPLTLVDRVRGYLARPDVTPTVRDVACGSPSRLCRHIELDAGTEPSQILGLLLPPERAADLPPARTYVTLDADATTLRPVHLVVDVTSTDGSVNVRLVVDASRWDTDPLISDPSTEPTAAP
jgi:hypothetical protein